MKPNEDDVIRIIEGITEIDNDLVIEADLFTVNSDQLKKRKMRNQIFRVAAISFCVMSLIFAIRLLLTKAYADEKKYSSKSDKTESDPWKVQEQSANGGESNIIIDYPEPEWFSDAVAEQEKAVEAHEILFEALNLNEKRDYPDDFGGDFIDGGKLYICVTSEESIAKYRRILADNPVVEYKIVKHSRNEIQQQVDSFVEEHKDEFVFYTYGVDVVNNCGVITTSDEYVEEMKKLLVGTGIVVNRGFRAEEEVSKDSEKNITSSINPASECEWNMDNEKKPDELYGENNESLLEIPDFMLSKKSDYIATNMNSLFELADVVIVGSLKENVETYVSDNALPVTTARISVERMYKGTVDKPEILIDYYGGTVSMKEYAAKQSKEQLQKKIPDYSDEVYGNMKVGYSISKTDVTIENGKQYLLYLAYNKMNKKYFVLCDGYGARRMEGETAYDPESGKMLPVPY